MKYLVTGVGGHTGTIVAHALLAAGDQVRAIVRNQQTAEIWRAKGAEVLVLDLTDTRALTAALRGVDGAYLLVPPAEGPGADDAQNAIFQSILSAVTTARPRHVVQLSSLAAQNPAQNHTQLILSELERGLRDLTRTQRNLHITILRVGYLMENIGNLKEVIATGKLPGFIPPDRPVEMVAASDIGILVAHLLREGGHGAELIELSGRQYSLQDAADILSEWTGKTITPIADMPRARQTTRSLRAVGANPVGAENHSALLWQHQLGAVVPRNEFTTYARGGEPDWDGPYRRLSATTRLRAMLCVTCKRSNIPKNGPPASAAYCA